MRTIVDAIVGHRGGPGTLTVLEADGSARTVGWAAVHDQARRVATRLRRHGVGQGSRVGLLADTGIDLVTTLQAAWLTGSAITMLPLPRRGEPAPASPAGPGDGYLRRIRGMTDDAGLDLVVIGHPAQHLRRFFTAWVPTVALSSLTENARTTEPATPVAPNPSDLAILQYTSGSTREPRGVPVTHGRLAANLASIAAATQHARVHGCAFSWLPLFHDMGLIGCLALPMSCGCALVLQSPAAFTRHPISWLEAITRYRATVTVAPNFAWSLMERLLRDRAAGEPAIELGSLRLALTGGEPVDPRAMRRFLAAAARHGLDPDVFTCAYGLAEATLAVTVSTPGRGLRLDVVEPDALERHGTARAMAGGRPGRALARLGRPVPDTRIRIMDRLGGHEVGERLVGHIEVNGPGVCDSHGGRPPAAPDGWLRTGDLGYVTDGELVVCGREKDLLFAAGRNVFPQDVEIAAGGVPGVYAGNVAAFGIPGNGGDRLAVAVESRAWADEAAVTAIRQAVATVVADEVGLTPRVVVVLAPGRLLKTSSGKLRRADTRLQYLAGGLVAAAGVTGGLAAAGTEASR